jgi:archaellum biogenesis ATPase FlaH
MFNDTMVRYTTSSDLISVDSVRSGMLTELVYSVSLQKKASAQSFLADLKRLNGNNKVTLITGYTATDL